MELLDRDGLYAENPEGEGTRYPGVFTAGLLYSIVVFLFLFFGTMAQSINFYSGIIITETALILLPTIIVLAISRYELKKVLRLNKVDLFNLFLVFCIMVFSIPVAGMFNIINIWLVDHIFGRSIIVQPPAATNLEGLLVNTLTVGLVAGVCEEVFFRGAIQRGLEKLGVAVSITLAAFLFSIMHVQFERLLGTFVLGIIIGFLVYRTNSLFSGIFAHFLNNTFGVLVTFAANKLSSISGPASFEQNVEVTELESFFEIFGDMSAEQMLAVIVLWIVTIATCVFILVALLYALVKNTKKEAAKAARREKVKKWEFLAFLPGLLLIIAMYFLQGIALKGFGSQAAKIILELIGA
ncbi:MAG: CPBP family intramembrane metalloprotease [Clostridiaceae bacterium]|nr:CPBP family intramembrane metalloprotease [Clostridiaceae bacterium]